jgi:group I intron endonuclease
MKVSGIYRIESISHPERVYIGSAVWLDNRWWKHLTELRKDKHHSSKLQNHFNKYGESDLVFSIIEPCLPENLIQREQYYIDTLNSYFNIARVAGSQLGMKRSNESRKKMSDSGKRRPPITEQTKAKLRLTQGGINNGHYGKHPTLETLFMQSESHKGIKQSEETIKKRVDKIRKPILQYDLSMNFIREWNSVAHASEKLLIYNTQIYRCLRGVRKTTRGFIWKYKNNQNEKAA